MTPQCEFEVSRHFDAALAEHEIVQRARVAELFRIGDDDLRRAAQLVDERAAIRRRRVGDQDAHDGSILSTARRTCVAAASTTCGSSASPRSSIGVP